MSSNNIDTKEKVYNFLETHAVGVLSTVDPDGKPQSSPIYFVVDNELNFFFLTKSDTKKSEDIENNNHAALTIVEPSAPITIQSTGTIKEVDDVAMYTKISEANAKEKGGFHWPPPIHKLHHSGDLVMYKFTPSWLRVADFSESENDNGTKDIFHKII